MKISKYNLAVFDLDGTLVHYEFDFFYEQTLSILPRLDYSHITREDLHLFFAQYDIFGFVPENDRKDFEDRFWEFWTHESNLDLRPFDDAEVVLDKILTKGQKVALATARNSLPEVLSEKLKHAGLLKYLQIVTTKHGCTLPWWDKTQMLIKLCKKVGIPPSSSYMVGDTPPDISSAKKVEFGGTIALLSGGIRRDILEKEDPDLLLGGIGDLAEWVEKM